ncbi:MAG TPA: S1/P1 nuclease [Coxiellaceae bacterium]|nr:MAG: hypothetical protein A3E81_02910 [Gammaproteobacteria bacterium RIFCSPHIGHO2_12_FULL_36_30]HLB56266.1 S1/P1 nuclease [Coxiellaceae bacterium]
MRFFTLTLALTLSFSTFAWNNAGHRVIAQIAYDQLTPQAKQKVDALTTVMFHSPYPSDRFLRAATWPDQLKLQTTQYNSWHYINLPYVKNNIQPPTFNSQNVVWAILRAEKIVADTKENNARRAKYLSFLIHFVGDIEQPLHCTTLYDTQFPQGDHGGNDYLIHSPIANNLHQLWDRGVGLFYSAPNNYQFHYLQVEKIATKWMNEYPTPFFAKQLAEKTPTQWAQESHQIAITFAYTLAENSVPSEMYISNAQPLVREQTVLAGYRLANLLNQLFS